MTLLPLASVSAQTLTGPIPDRVYQRDAQDSASIPFVLSDIPAVATRVVMSLRQGDTELESKTFETFTKPVSDSFKGKTGGPYSVVLEVYGKEGQIAERKIEGILVGDIWILAGQSNMEGTAHLQDTEPPSPYVHVMGLDDQWGIAEDPLSDPGDAIDPVHWRTTISTLTNREGLDFIARINDFAGSDLTLRKRPVDDDVRSALSAAGIEWNTFLNAMRPDRGRYALTRMDPGRGAGLGVAFGKHLYEETGVPIGLMINANGGTDMEQWHPDLGRYGGESLYGSLVRRIRQSGGKVKGIAWYQGESDADTAEGVQAYSQRTKDFIEALRKDTGDSELPFVYVQIARVYDKSRNTSWWNSIQTQQLALESELSPAWMVPAIEETMSDHIHLDAIGLRKLGRKMADVVLGGVYGKNIDRGPRIKEAILEGPQLLRLRFSNVNGELTLRSPMPEFVLRDGDRRFQFFDKIEIDAEDKTSVLLHLLYPAGEDLSITYGFGINPVTGLADDFGLPVPVFGPVSIQQENIAK